MKKWVKNNKGILIMGAFFAVGSSVTAALVCSAPNYVITSVEVKEFLPTNVTAYAGVAGESPAFIYAVVNGYSQRGGQQHIFFNWSLERDKNDNAKLPPWLSIEPIYTPEGKPTQLAKLVWTDECEKNANQYHLYAIASHLDVTGKLSTPYEFIVV